MLQKFIPKETKRIIYEACERHAKKKELNLSDVQLSLGLRFKDGMEDEVEVTYTICEKYKPIERLTFLQVLGVRFDFKGYGNFAPAVIQNGLIRYALEYDIDPTSVRAVCLPFDEQITNKKGKLETQKNVKVYIYKDHSQYIKTITVEEFISLEMDLEMGEEEEVGVSDE